jgi:hypothetical protein
MTDSLAYCRDVEAYLCKKNGGHLIRIDGPAFELVKAWAAQGMPLKIVFRGIDRACDRQAAKPGRRRPLRIEFCEADVLAAFDEWRRAVGTSQPADDGAAPSRKEPLATHIERTVTRLLAVRTQHADHELAGTIASTIDALDELAASARQARGESRAAIVTRLAELDAALLGMARERVPRETADALRREAEAEIAPFTARMPPEARARTSSLAYDRLLREALGLPVLSYE